MSHRRHAPCNILKQRSTATAEGWTTLRSAPSRALGLRHIMPEVSTNLAGGHRRYKHESETARFRKSLTSTAVNYRWSSHDPAMFGRAMVLAGETLFVAGPPAIRNEATKEALQCWLGSQGGILWALSRQDGTRLAEYDLPTTPVFDGMAAAHGRLYIALTDGSVLCLQQKSE